MDQGAWHPQQGDRGACHQHQGGRGACHQHRGACHQQQGGRGLATDLNAKTGQRLYFTFADQLPVLTEGISIKGAGVGVGTFAWTLCKGNVTMSGCQDDRHQPGSRSKLSPRKAQTAGGWVAGRQGGEAGAGGVFDVSHGDGSKQQRHRRAMCACGCSCSCRRTPSGTVAGAAVAKSRGLKV